MLPLFTNNSYVAGTNHLQLRKEWLTTDHSCRKWPYQRLPRSIRGSARRTLHQEHYKGHPSYAHLGLLGLLMEQRTPTEAEAPAHGNSAWE